MPRPTLYEHPKFMRLCHLLKMPRPHVLGHLEFMWRVGYVSGNPELGDAVNVEIAAEWTGEPGALVAALMDKHVRMIDRRGKIYFIHDLHENAPDYVRARHRMHNWRKRKNGTQILRNSDEVAEELRNESATENDTSRLRNGYGSTAPAPAHSFPPTPRRGVAGGVGRPERKKTGTALAVENVNRELANDHG